MLHDILSARASWRSGVVIRCPTDGIEYEWPEGMDYFIYNKIS